MAPQARPTSWLEGHKGQRGALPEAKGGAQGPRAQEAAGEGRDAPPSRAALYKLTGHPRRGLGQRGSAGRRNATEAEPPLS